MTKNVTWEVELLKKELLAQGDLLNQEILERRAEVDRLKIQVDALKKLLDQLQPGFISKFDGIYAEERQKFDPERERSAS